MADDVDIKDFKKIFYRVRGRFIKTIREAVEPAFRTALEPIAQQAASLAPRRTGLLGSRIAVTVKVTQYRVLAAISPTRLGRGDKNYPFYGLFQERGWWLTTKTPKGRAAMSRREARASGAGPRAGTRRRIRFMTGHPFLKPAALAGIPQAFETWKPLIVAAFERLSNAEAESAGQQQL